MSAWDSFGQDAGAKRALGRGSPVSVGIYSRTEYSPTDLLLLFPRNTMRGAMGVAPLMRPRLAPLVRLVSAVQRFARYGIGRGPGTGATAQIADAHGGRGG